MYKYCVHKYFYESLTYSYIFLGEIDVDKMYVVDETDCSVDVGTALDDKYATAVEPIDIPRKGSY